VDEHRVKHLEFIQAVISRQAGNSFLIKGWAITVATGFYGFAAQQKSWKLGLVGLLPVAVFGLLDAYYLRQERLFRCLYEDAITTETTVPNFSMDIGPYKSNKHPSWNSVLNSNPLRVLYVAILGAGIVLTIALAVHSSAPEHACRRRSARSSVNPSGHGRGGGQMSPIRSWCQRGTK
jgi:hypothetical protein